jgi:hypothetical protein
MTNMRGKLTAGALVGIGLVAALYALQARRLPGASEVALESAGVTVYKTPT